MSTTVSFEDFLKNPRADGVSERVTHAVDWMLCNGALMRTASDNLTHAPFSLFPTPIPKILFERLSKLGIDINLLVDRIARDGAFLEETLSSVVKADVFTRNLMEIFQTVQAEGIKQKMYLGLHRSDYMLHTEGVESAVTKDGLPVLPLKALQVEFNTISSAFGAMASRISRLHSALVSRFYPDGFKCDTVIPDNFPDRKFVDAMAVAARHVQQETPCVLMVVQPGERNAVDQRSLEFDLWQRHEVALFRRSLAQLDNDSFLNDDGALMLRVGSESEPRRICVVYYRAGYTPDDYPTQKEWDVRLKLERSDAVKCPSIAYHLVGTKKVQQVLALPGTVERFADHASAKSIREVFADMRSLDVKEQSEDEVAKTVEEVSASPERWVMKPQREGGGNNAYGADVVKLLDELPKSEWPAYILMSRIFPPTTRGYLVRDGKLHTTDCLSELGVYSAFLGDGDQVVVNESCGHVLRTKPESSDEGGVASGFAVLDSALLV